MKESRITIEAAISLFLSYCESKNLTPDTVRWYGLHLRDVARFVSRTSPFVADVTTAHLREWTTHLLTRISPTSTNHKVTTLKTFFRFLVDEGIVDCSPADRLPKVKTVHRLVQPFSQEQLEALLRAPNQRRFAGFRDQKLMLLLLDTALRISEVLDIRLGDIDWTRNLIRVLGKGGKERIVPFGKTAKRALREYIERRGDVDTDYLFVNEFGERVSVRQIQDSIAAYGRVAGITGVRVSPHTFRHTSAVNWIRNGGDVFSLQRLLGHTSLEMVRHYCNLANEDLERAHKSFSPVDRMLANTQNERSQRKRLR